ncbi:isoprenylcysteine carboxylmethyltransferase family protein [Zunongwangia sp. SCSIO 43204]|uniref:methyltransferase family protein n=1 Tax=Zunongwangia sp. SCSIO 43204 TaxID=2779359 RepID=UPI001CA9A6D5|nr:isoprenylcysteine carboxylmethyltransferase family protein [Zunongwangia sp. SCSIO 43204]UAB84403.1 isoprenylcysteine carboxylmethyltransferase family protein [Zunongwangia sp. SCSIO 43204]
MNNFKKNSEDILYVVLQFILFIIYVFEYEKWEFEVPYFIKVISILTGVFGILVSILSLLQLGRNFSPFPSPKSRADLKISGVYHYVRHPMYTGELLIAFSFSIFVGSGLKIFISFLLAGLFFLKSKYEEGILIQKFSNYYKYKKKTGRFLPK